jgi:hypothetical protein
MSNAGTGGVTLMQMAENIRLGLDPYSEARTCLASHVVHFCQGEMEYDDLRNLRTHAEALLSSQDSLERQRQSPAGSDPAEGTPSPRPAPGASERLEAIAIASRWLEEPYADPDGDQCVVARQFERSQEQIQQLREALQRFMDFQISDYDQISGRAEAYCEIRRVGRKVIEGWRNA